MTGQSFLAFLLGQKEVTVSARTKLNAAAVHGASFVAAVIGWAAGSWVAFLLATAVLIDTAWHSGAIRTGPGRR